MARPAGRVFARWGRRRVERHFHHTAAISTPIPLESARNQSVDRARSPAARPIVYELAPSQSLCATRRPVVDHDHRRCIDAGQNEIPDNGLRSRRITHGTVMTGLDYLRIEGVKTDLAAGSSSHPSRLLRILIHITLDPRRSHLCAPIKLFVRALDPALETISTSSQRRFEPGIVSAPGRASVLPVALRITVRIAVRIAGNFFQEATGERSRGVFYIGHTTGIRTGFSLRAGLSPVMRTESASPRVR